MFHIIVLIVPILLIVHIILIVLVATLLVDYICIVPLPFQSSCFYRYPDLLNMNNIRLLEMQIFDPGFDERHSGDVIIVTADRMRFFFRLDILCNLSTLFNHCLKNDLCLSERHYNDEDGNLLASTSIDLDGYISMYLPGSTCIGVKLLLCCIDHWTKGQDLEPPESLEAFMDALLISKRYEIHLTRKALVPFARETMDGSHPKHSFAMLAVYLLAGLGKDVINAQVKLTFKEGAVGLPEWIKKAIRSVSPHLFERLLEIHLANATLDGFTDRIQKQVDAWKDKSPDEQGCGIADKDRVCKRSSIMAARILQDLIDANGLDDLKPNTFKIPVRVLTDLANGRAQSPGDLVCDDCKSHAAEKACRVFEASRLPLLLE